jgi:hypothetical protein
MPEQDVTTNEIMEFLKEHMVTRAELDQKFDAIDQKFGAIDQKFDAIDQKFGAIDQKFETLERKLRSEIRGSELRMMDAMDDKLANLKGDLTVMMRGEDKKVSFLIRLLEKKQVLTAEEAGSILSLQPFPQA